MGNGYYKIDFQSGNWYIGKGNTTRMNNSANRLAKTYGDKVLNKTHFPASNTAESFKGEAKLMRDNGWYKGHPKSYNKIKSPGYRLLNGKGGLVGGALKFFNMVFPIELFQMRTIYDPCTGKLYLIHYTQSPWSA